MDEYPKHIQIAGITFRVESAEDEAHWRSAVVEVVPVESELEPSPLDDVVLEMDHPEFQPVENIDATKKKAKKKQ